mmetsp:Transcript_83089/g.220460  ORF Transcript_83089/g.220460 Transcript_83089/m.220460 type:complete len:358 (-) Transcript_83089:73-1146(-)
MSEKENAALAKLQAAAGLIVEKPVIERLDWMYEQSAVQQTKTDEDARMNMAIAAEKDKDLQDMKALGESTAGSLFLRSATKTTEDMLRKLREDPLFQIRRQEQAARESMMANPLIRARIEQKALKGAKKQQKKEKKAAKKAKKAAKKAKKAAKKAAKGSSSSSSSSSSASSGAAAAANSQSLVAGKRQASPQRASDERASKRRASPQRGSDERASRRQSPPPRGSRGSAAELGPSGHIVSKREEYEATVAARKEAALASRGAPRRMSEEEKRQRLERMSQDARSHERFKDHRIASAEQTEREQAEREAKMRMGSDQKYFREIRQDAYMDSGSTVADRLKNQRHRRQKQLNDPLERDG